MAIINRPTTRRKLAVMIQSLVNQINELMSLTTAGTAAGSTWYVNSVTGVDDQGHGKTALLPFATLAYAHTSAVTAKGDTIIVAPGHAESVNIAAYTTLSKNDIEIVGQGVGNRRPTFTWTATAGQIIVSGAGIKFRNIVFDFTGIDAVVAAISVTGADVEFDNCDMITNSGTAGCVLGVLTAATAARFKIINSRLIGPATNSGTTTTAQVKHEVGVDYVFANNYCTGKMTQSFLNATAVLRGQIHNNVFVVATGTVAITMHASSTPMITGNFINVPSGTAPITAAAGFVAGNRYSAAAGVTAGTALTI